MTDTRHIRQTFNRAAGLELRSTWQSTRAYKRHCHPQLSIGAIVEGQTCCVSHGNAYVLDPGDLIMIPAYAPHSCNPVVGKPRSYHMLYIDTDLPWRYRLFAIPRSLSTFLPLSGRCPPHPWRPCFLPFPVARVR